MAGISVHVTITIDPKDKDAFLAALKPTFEAVKAEPLNLFFEISYDEKNPGVFKLIESWNCTAEYIMSVSNTILTATFCSYITCIDQLCLFYDADPAPEGLLQALPCCCRAPAP